MSLPKCAKFHARLTGSSLLSLQHLSWVCRHLFSIGQSRNWNSPRVVLLFCQSPSLPNSFLRAPLPQWILLSYYNPCVGEDIILFSWLLTSPLSRFLCSPSALPTSSHGRNMGLTCLKFFSDFYFWRLAQAQMCLFHLDYYGCLCHLSC